MKRLLTLKETAELLKISYSTLLKLIKENKIPYLIVSKSKRKRIIRFDEETLLNFLKQNMSKNSDNSN